jgi:hypothetical protein
VTKPRETNFHHRAVQGLQLAAGLRSSTSDVLGVPQRRYTRNVKLLSAHPWPPISLTQGVAWPGTTARVEFDFVAAGLPSEFAPCKHAIERRTLRGELELWRIPKALVSYRSASIIVSAVCLECVLDAETEGAEAARGETPA